MFKVGLNKTITQVMHGENTGRSYFTFIQAFKLLEDNVSFPEIKSQSERELMDLVGDPKIYFFDKNLTFAELAKIAHTVKLPQVIPLFSDYVEIHPEINMDILKSMRILPNSLVVVLDVNLPSEVSQLKEMVKYFTHMGSPVLWTTQTQSK